MQVSIHSADTDPDRPGHSSYALLGAAALTFGRVERRFGGPEEGGWWYDHFTPIRTYLVPRARIAVLRRRLERVVSGWNEGRRPLGSVLSTGLYALYEGIEPATPIRAYS